MLRAYTDDGEVLKIVDVDSDNHDVIATIAYTDDDNEDDRRASLARLFAAAPELLAACQELAEYAANAMEELTDQNTGWYYQLQRAVQVGRAAIAKALNGVSS